MADQVLSLQSGQPSPVYWMVFVTVDFLMWAARSSWDLPVKVGDARRANAA